MFEEEEYSTDFVPEFDKTYNTIEQVNDDDLMSYLTPEEKLLYQQQKDKNDDKSKKINQKKKNNRRGKKNQQNETESNENAKGKKPNRKRKRSDSTKDNKKDNLKKRKLDVIDDETMNKLTEEELFEAMQGWDGLGLNPLLLKGLYRLKYFNPTKIQRESLVPAIRDKKDIVGAAATGSGKTLAFGLPILHQILRDQEKGRAISGLQCVIISPTRELSMQIVEHLKAASKYCNILTVAVVGGISIPKQERQLSYKPQIIVATPGRLKAFVEDGKIDDVSEVKYIVLDEADRLLEYGFYNDIENILNRIRFTKNEGIVNVDQFDENEQEKKIVKIQSFVFSATMSVSPEVRERLNKKKAKRTKKKTEGNTTIDNLLELMDFDYKVKMVDVTSEKVVVDTLKETKIECLESEKDIYLYYFTLKYPGRTIVFVNSISCLKRLIPIFQLLKVPVYGIHAKMQQRQRLKNLDRLRDTEHSVIIATDVLSRGVDVPEIDHVIHYQLPRTTEIYVHRSGRTARANRDGLSLMLVDPSENLYYKNILSCLSSNDIESFPVDMSYIPQITTRIKLAVKLNTLINQNQKTKKSDNWLLAAAEEMDIDVPEGMLSDKTTNENKKIQIEMEKLKLKLQGLLSQQLVSRGVSKRYLTRNKIVMLDSGKTTALEDVQNS